MARPLKPFVRSGGYYPSAKYTPLVYPGGYTTLNAKNGKPEPINTFLGKIVRFLAKRSLPMVKLEANFTPIQNLNGQEAPWPPGGGKNVFGGFEKSSRTVNGITFSWNSDGSIHAKGTASAQANLFVTANNGFSLPEGTYTVSITSSGSQSITYVFGGDGTAGVPYSELYSNSPNLWKKTITSTGGTLYYNVVRVPTGATVDDDIYIQYELGSTATAWSPYENICPISGHTGCDIFDKAEYDAQATPTVSISFGQTVYGGQLTVNEDGSGQIVASYYGHIFDGTEDNITQLSSDDSRFIRFAPGIKFDVSGRSCSHFPNVRITTSNSDQGYYAYTTSTGNGYMQFRWADLFTTTDEFKSYCAAQYAAGTPLTAIAEMTEPVTIPLTPGQIQTLVGENVVWVNDSDNIQVTAYGSPIT